MPQMKPMNWINIFIFMNLILMMMNIKNFFMKNYKNYSNYTKKMMNEYKWMW